MPNSHIRNIQTIATGLGDLLDQVVFIGGAVAELYAFAPGASEIRITLYVVCVIEIRSRKAYYELEVILRSKGFSHDTSKDAPICRWIYEGVLVDLMPTKEEILGFTNSWYEIGISNKIPYILPDGVEIAIFPPEVYLASKIEAFNNRGSQDFRQSHDFEDIIYLLDNKPDIQTDIVNSDDHVKEFIKKEFSDLLLRSDLLEGVECALPFGTDSNGIESIMDLLQSIANI